MTCCGHRDWSCVLQKAQLNRKYGLWTASTLLWMLAGLLMAAQVVSSLGDQVQRLDDWTWEQVVTLEQDTVVSLAEGLDVLGGLLVMLVAIVVAGLYFAWQKNWVAFALWTAAMSVSQLLNWGLKHLFDRERPALPLVETATSSFPSGHALTAAAFSIMLVWLLVDDERDRRRWMVVAVVWAVLMAASRVYLRAHWLSDVVAGFAIGAGTVLVVVMVGMRSNWSRLESSP